MIIEKQQSKKNIRDQQESRTKEAHATWSQNTIGTNPYRTGSAQSVKLLKTSPDRDSPYREDSLKMPNPLAFKDFANTYVAP